jgi:hypothetical protein
MTASGKKYLGPFERNGISLKSEGPRVETGLGEPTGFDTASCSSVPEITPSNIADSPSSLWEKVS